MEFDLELHDKQLECFGTICSKRFSVIVAGRRFGKSELAACWLLVKSLNKLGNYAYVTMSYKATRRIFWPILKRIIPTSIIKITHETDLTITLINGSKISCYGSDKADSLRGVGLDGVVVDEVSYLYEAKNLIENVLRPTLSDKKGAALYISTPNGYDYFCDMYKYATEANDPDWCGFKYRTIDNPLIDPMEIESARNTMDARSFQSEYLADFVTTAERLYDEFSRDIHVKPCKFDPKLAVTVGVDFNVSPMTAVLAQEHSNGELWIFGEYVENNSHSRKLGQWLLDHYGQVDCHCDPTGSARSHTLGSSDVDVLRGMGHRVSFRRFSSETDKWNSLKSYLKTASGKVRLFIDPSAKTLIRQLEQVTVDSEEDHATDACAYLILSKFNPCRRERWGRYTNQE